MKLSDKRRFTFFLAATVAIVACYLAGSLIYVGVMRRNNEAQSYQYLSDATDQTAATVDQLTESNYELLQSAAVGITEVYGRNEADVIDLLEAINLSNHFVRMGVSGLDGIAMSVDMNGNVYRNVDLSDTDFFAQAMSGKMGMSNIVEDWQSGEPIVFNAVPIYQNGIVTGMVYGVDTNELLLRTLDSPVFRSSGTYYIVNGSGKLLTSSSNTLYEVSTGESLFEGFDFTDDEWARAEEMLESETPGHVNARYGGEEQALTLVPLHFNHWFVVSAVPLGVINDYYNQAIIGVSVIIFAACLIFLFLMYVQLRSVARNQRELERLAYVDLLTEKRNYVKFLLDAAELIQSRPGVKFAVWSHDVKSFNGINDMFGREIGNRVLQRIANVFAQSEARDGGVFCRMAADNFVGIRPYTDKDELTAWFDWFIATLAKREVISEKQMHIDDSMGIYCIDEFDDILTVDEMATRASMARKAAKKLPGSQLLFFTQAMGNKLRWGALLEAEADEALRCGEITFFLQPKVSIQNGYHITGAEALARWNHRVHGLIPPDEFISLFERNGFVVRMDRVLFQRVCEWCAGYVKNEGPPLRISVNVSRQGMLREDFIEYYSHTLQKYDLPERTIELEFTESTSVVDTAFFRERVIALHQAGFVCSIDDFGSGYSSLNILKELPIDVLKLDAVFFRNSHGVCRERTVIEGFIRIARELEIRTVAEGVETPTQVHFLQSIGCDTIQGYIFSRPLDVAAFEALLARTKGHMELPPEDSADEPE